MLRWIRWAIFIRLSLLLMVESAINILLTVTLYYIALVVWIVKTRGGKVSSTIAVHHWVDWLLLRRLLALMWNDLLVLISLSHTKTAPLSL